jgi:hypothetical protein
MPFHILILIVFFSITVGVVLMRYLIFPFFKREDTP